MDEVIKKDFNPLLNSEMWDILIVLDACRYDSFKKVNTIPGKLTKRISFSSCTSEWIESVWGRDLSHIVYISANPLVSKRRMVPERLNIKFEDFIDAWNFYWNDDLKSVLPDRVTSGALFVRFKYPKHKLVVHYIQPHHPFIGKTKIDELGYEQIRLREKGEDISQKVFEKVTVYQKVKDGAITYEHCIKCYEDNLKLVLDSLGPLLKLPGKKIITSDHGDCFGEDGIFAHPAGSNHPLLIEVPWFEPQNNE